LHFKKLNRGKISEIKLIGVEIMKFEELPPLCFGDYVAKIPIILGGMGVGITLSGIASAMSNQGAIGVISATGIGFKEPDFFLKNHQANIRALQNQIRKTRLLTAGIIGINIMVALTDFNNLLRTAVQEKADIIFMGAGLPLKLQEAITMDEIQFGHTQFVPIVSSGRAADFICKHWMQTFNRVPNGFVVEGPLAGGHLGFKADQLEDEKFRLEKILVDVIQAVAPYQQKLGKKIPVVAAGGVYSGEDMYRMMQLGADGVQMATRFIATHECDASLKFKQAVVDCNQDDLTIIKSPVGMPGRAIKNKFLRDVKDGLKVPIVCPVKCLKTCNYKEAPYCIALALTNAEKGEFDKGFAFVGAKAYKVNKIVSVAELLNTIKEEFNAAASA